MKLDRDSFDLKYVSDEIMSNLSLAQDYPTVFTIQGTFSCLSYFCQTFILLDNFACFFHLFILFRITLLLKQIASVSKSWNSDLAYHFVRPD